MSKIKAIIWDWNGTLLDDLNCCIQIMNMMLQKRNLPKITIADYQDHFSFPVINYYLKLGFNFQKENFNEVSHEFIALYNSQAHTCTLQPDSIETIKKTKK
ncbi:HAD family hydrolase [Candidatus Margulisiibacteriota bacterium]